MTLPSLQDYEVTLVSTSGSATSYALAVSLEPLLQVSPTPMLAPPTASLTATATATETTRSAATPTPSPITPTVGTEPAISGTPLTATVIITPTASPSGAVLPSVPAGSEAYLTFDAASQAPGWGAAIAEALADHGVTGTFFIGDWGSDDATALLAGGQQLGYLDVAARTPDRIGREAMLQDVREALASPGVAPCVRPSYGAMDALSRAALAEAGLQVVLWDVVLDPSGPGPEVVDEGDGMTDAVVAAADRLLAQVYPGATVRVVVDGNADHVAGVLRRALPQLTGMGFDLVASCRDAATE